MVLVDYRKAFDLVDHKLLLNRERGGNRVSLLLNMAFINAVFWALCSLFYSLMICLYTSALKLISTLMIQQLQLLRISGTYHYDNWKFH